MKKGFSLVELLVIIAIIGLLGSIIAASYNTANSSQSFEERCKEKLQSNFYTLSELPAG